MRCSKCKERYQPGGSLEASNLDVRCPHCAQRKRQKRAARANSGGFDLPIDPFTGPSSNWIWITALAGGAVLLVLICLGVAGLGLFHVGSPRNAATPAKAPTTQHGPTRISSPSPGEDRKPAQISPEMPDDGNPAERPRPRANDNDWDR
jgi:hypothetical protein